MAFFILKKMACEEDYIDCDNKEISSDQLFRKLIAKLANGKPAIRICGDAAPGPGGGDVLVGQTLFVSSAGKTVAAGAVRESLNNHYSNINEAIADAIAGDTIHVYGGSHVVTTNLYKDGVIWEFHGVPFVSAGFGLQSMFSGSSGTLIIKGDAVFYHGFYSGGSVGKLFNFSGACNVNVDCLSIQGQGSIMIQIAGTTLATFNVREDITKYSADYCIRLYEAPTVIFNCKTINDQNPSTTNFSSCIYLENNYVGNATFNVNEIRKTSSNQFSVIRIEAIGGKLTINGNITYTTSIGTSFWQQAIWVNGFTEFIHNGNLTTNAYGYRIFGGNGNTLRHNKGVWRCITNTLTVPNLVYGITTNNKFYLHGQYLNEGQSEDVINIGGAVANLSMNGAEVYQKALGLPVSSGLKLQGGNVIAVLNNVVFVSSLSGTNYCINSAVAQNIRIQQGNVASNVAANPNITNVVVGTNLIVDTNINFLN